jgi:hypothetical protein
MLTSSRKAPKCALRGATELCIYYYKLIVCVVTELRLTTRSDERNHEHHRERPSLASSKEVVSQAGFPCEYAQTRLR